MNTESVPSSIIKRRDLAPEKLEKQLFEALREYYSGKKVLFYGHVSVAHQNRWLAIYVFVRAVNGDPRSLVPNLPERTVKIVYELTSMVPREPNFSLVKMKSGDLSFSAWLPGPERDLPQFNEFYAGLGAAI
jgi:hypothetical protein